MDHWEKEQKIEQERVNKIVNLLNGKIETLKQHLGGKKSDVVEIRQKFWEDVTVNFEDAYEEAETAASIRQQAELLSEIERSHKNANTQLKAYTRLKDSPYFGRIDFTEQGEQTTDQIYLGIASFYDELNDQFLIYDWRAPISSLYYDHTLGPVEYVAPNETIKGTMDLKRQYIIRNSIIKSMFDTGVTIGDELLQEVLGNQANLQMKSIVATIQKEQNEIIRNTKGSLLIVKGAAGCGKTSAALQRVAYLLYRERETLAANQIVLFSPNSMFNGYVANVLPELGEDNMQQTTFQEYVDHLLGTSFKLENPFHQMETLLHEMEGIEREVRVAGIEYKASVDFMNVIEGYTAALGKKGMCFKDVKFRGRVLIPASAIQQYFYKLDSFISIPNRLRLVSEWLLAELKQFEQQERKEEWVEEKIHLLDESVYTKLFQKLVHKNHYTDDSFNDLNREQEVLSKIVVQKAFKPLRRRVEQLSFLNVKKMYCDLFSAKFEPFIATLGESLPEHWKKICQETVARIKENELTAEDATSYLFFKERLEGIQTNTNVRYVFIDEAQDYSPFQFAFIKRLFPRAKMTVLGDTNQSIFAHSTGDGLNQLEKMYTPERVEKMILTRSYRSTKPIVEFTKELLLEGGNIIPFNRNGKLPVLRKVEDHQELTRRIIDRIQSWQRENHQTIAIICKTVYESLSAYEALKPHLPIRLIQNENDTYQQGILIIPSYLAKGIEFDAVIIYNASQNVYGRESERKLFYTACTRAMHELQLFCRGEWTPFLNNVPDSLYRIGK